MRYKAYRSTVAAAVGLAVILMGGSFAAQAQTIDKQIRVTLPYPVTVGETTLEPGEYMFREVSDRLLQVFDTNQMRAEAAVITIDTQDQRPSEETKVVLHKFDENSPSYLIDKIWVAGLTRGYEFPVPEQFRSLEREREESVAGQYEDYERSV